MVRTAVRWFALLLAILAGCAAPPFPLNQPSRPPEVAQVAWASTLMFTDGRRLCSAVLVGSDLALTAKHCLGDSFQGGVLLHPDGQAHAVLRVAVAADADIAFLQLTPESRQSVELGEVQPDQLGYALGYGCTRGARLDARPVRFLGRFQPQHIPGNVLLDVWAGVACTGDSGGGVYSADGQLLGISVLIGESAEDGPLLLTIPAELIAPVLR